MFSGDRKSQPEGPSFQWETRLADRDHSILYVLVCEIKFSHMGKNNGSPDLVCKNKMSKFWPESSYLSLLCVRAMTTLGCA